MIKYDYAGSQRVAMRVGSNAPSYLLGDHLGSTSLTASSSGGKVAELRYHPWGGTRYISGTTPTSYQFTGQLNDSSIGLYFYNARYYDSALGRFIQADTIVPSPANPQSLNRYSYVLNSPLRYTDPTGHLSNDEIMELFGVQAWEDVLAEFRRGGRLAGRWGFLEMLSKLIGPRGNGTTEMARLYASPGARPYGRFDNGYPNAGDTLVMTLRAVAVNGQLALLECLGEGRARQVSVFDAGLVGDIWTSYHQGHEERLGNAQRGHGFLTGNSSHIVTFDPNEFDAFGAVLDAGGLLAEAFGLKIVNGVISGIEVARGWPAVAIAALQVSQGEAPLSTLIEPTKNLLIDFGGIVNPIFDVIDLYINFRDGAYIDKVR